MYTTLFNAQFFHGVSLTYKKLIVSLLFGFIICTVEAQNQQRDSLLTEILNAQTHQEQEQQFDSLYNLTFHDPDLADTAYSVLMQMAQKSDNERIFAECINSKGIIRYRDGRYQESLDLFYKSLDIFEKLEAKNSIAQAWNNIGSSFTETGDMTRAEEYCRKSLNLALEIKDDTIASESYNDLGIVLYQTGKLKEALEMFYKSIEVKKKANLGSFSSTYNNIAAVHWSLQEYDKALEFLRIDLIEQKLSGEDSDFATSLNNVGIMHYYLGNNDSAMAYYHQAIEYSNRKDHKDKLPLVYLNMSLVFHSRGEIDTAIAYLKRSEKIYAEMGEKSGLLSVYLNLSKIYTVKEDMDKATKYGTDALRIAKEMDYKQEIASVADHMKDLYKKQNKWEMALEMNDLHHAMNDSILNLDNKTAAMQKKMAFEFDKKEALSEAEHQKEMEVADAKQAQQSKIIYLSVGIGVLILLIAFLLFNRLNVVRKQKQVIEAKNKENELLLGEIHHRVKNNLQVVSSLLNFQQRNLKDTEAKEAVIESRNRVRSMALIHKKLYQHDDFSAIEMLEYTKQLAEELVSAFRLQENNVELNIQFQPLKLDVDSAVPVGLIINELLVNSMKYAFEHSANPAINIRIEEQNGELVLEYADNGTGITTDEENEPKENTEETSFGSRLIESLSRQLNGGFERNNQDGLRYSFRFKAYQTVQ